MLRDFIDDLIQDLRFTVREWRAAPGFAAAAIATLVIGIGATAAVFSLFDAVVLAPLPFADPDRVVNVHPARNGDPVVTSSGIEFATWEALKRVFSATAAYVPQNSLSLEHAGTPKVVTATRASAGFDRVIGIAPQLGRAFGPADDAPGAPNVVLLSHRLWIDDFRGDPAVVGQLVRLDGVPFTVIGVWPASIDEIGVGDVLWTPLRLSSTELLDFKARTLRVIARLADGATPGQATQAVNDVEQRLSAQFPMWGTGYTGQVRPYADELIGDVRGRVTTILGAVLLVFLIACVNVANLVLARGSSRRREFSIRAALGADRRRLMKQLGTECGLLTVIAGVAGVALAVFVDRLIVALSPPGVPRIESAHVSGPALVFTFIVCTACCILVGLLPARRASSAALNSMMRDGARAAGEGNAALRGRDMLMTLEVVMAMTLLSGAGFLVRSAWELSRVDAGFTSASVLTARVLLPAMQYPDASSSRRAYRAILDGVRSTPAIRDAAFTSSLPLDGGLRAGIGAEDAPLTDGQRFIAPLRIVTPGYFRTLGIRLVAGRDFTSADNADAPNVAIISPALANRFWPGERAVGKRFEGMSPDHQHFMTVVGVTAGVRDQSLDQPPGPEFYIPLEQTPAPLWAGAGGSLTLVARTNQPPLSLEHRVRDVIRAFDPGLPIARVATLDAVATVSRAGARFTMGLFAALGAIALLLATVGVYGVTAYSVSQRTRDIGVRMALGATPATIAALVIRRALGPVIGGVAMGGVSSVYLTRMLRQQLYGVQPGDPQMMTAIALFLIGVSILAVALPARRAMRVPPVTALAGT